MSTGSQREGQIEPSTQSGQPSTRHTGNGGQSTNFDPGNVVAFIGHGVEFNGVIKYQGSVRVDGKLDGEVHAEGTLYLGEQAVISAKIIAQSVISKGRITGDVKARETVQLLTPAILNGSVTTPSLMMEEGVLFNGTCEMNNNKGKETKKEDPMPLMSVSEVLNPV